MQVTVVSTRGAGRLLPELRALLARADRALICAAYVSDAGVHLLREPLAALGGRARILTTTAFGSTTSSALNEASRIGNEVAVLNPSTGSYHPKLYLAAAGDEVCAVVGSANLTGGLVNNHEAAAARRDAALAEAWRIGEALWRDPRVVPWVPVTTEVEEREREQLSAPLLAQINAVVARDPLLFTLGPSPKPNRITAVTPTGVYVATNATASKDTPAQLVDAWMIQLAYDYLVEHGRLTNRYLIARDGLGVHRSSFVCALLARLPGVRRVEGRAVALAYGGTDQYKFEPIVRLAAEGGPARLRTRKPRGAREDGT